MNELEKARREIDAVDREMAELFVRRMRAVEEVAEYKKRRGLQIYDPERENSIINKNALLIEDESLRPYYVEFMKDTMKASRHYQRRRLEGIRVAFAGIEGAFAFIAASKLFPDGEKLPYPDFQAAYTAVENGECDVCILPIENSTAGEVGQVTDLMFSGNLFVTGVLDLSVRHNLLGVEGADPSTVKEVISHPQALAQCRAYIEERGFKEISAGNTAMAAKEVAERSDPTIAAIASEETAELYGLKVLEKGINETSINTTRFVVLSRSLASVDTSDKHFILMFTVRNEAGFLAKAIGVIGSHGYNMRCLRSRPMKELLWQYYFYVELEGDPDSESGRAMIDELSDYCDKLKILGSFRYSAEV